MSTCFQRLQTRNQVGDHGVSLEYLKLLDKNYNEVYTQMEVNENYRCIYYNSASEADRGGGKGTALQSGSRLPKENLTRAQASKPIVSVNSIEQLLISISNVSFDNQKA